MNENFEMRKADYFERLKKIQNEKSGFELFKDKTQNLEIQRIVLNPSSDEELEVANAYITFIEDALNLALGAADDTIIVDPKESEAIDLLSDMVKLLMGDPSEKELYEVKGQLANQLTADNYRLLAEFIGDCLVLNINDSNGFLETLATKANIKFENVLQLVQLELALFKFKELANLENVIPKGNFNSEIIVFSSTFHEYYLAHNKQNVSEEKNEKSYQKNYNNY